jgi:hypothetical protein
LEADMASLVVIALIVVVAGALLGAFLRLSLVIRREDRAGTLGVGAPSGSAQIARIVVGFSRRIRD